MIKAGWFGARMTAIALAVLAGSAALPLAAHAQFFGGWGYDQPYRRPAPPSRGFFSFPFFNRPFFGRPARPPAESYRAPPPRKLATPPTTTVVVIGDSMADWLAYGLEEIYADEPQIGIVRNIRLYSGLIHYEPHNDAAEWSQQIKDILANEKPAAIVVMLGLNDRVPIRVPEPAREAAPHNGKRSGEAEKSQDQESKSATRTTVSQQAAASQAPAPGLYEFRSDEWAKLYAKRIDDMMTALKSKGVPVLWVGLPAIRGPIATADMSYLDDLYRTSADRNGIDYVDIWNGFVDEDGRYTVEGPDFEGQIRRLRSGDGIHFTRYGALKLAHLVDQELGRIIANPAASALPSGQGTAPTKPGAARPAIGPVLPLTASGGTADHSGDDADHLLGGSDQASTDLGPVAADVLVRGDALAAPADRADNFGWPPGETDAKAAAPKDAAPPAQPAAAKR